VWTGEWCKGVSTMERGGGMLCWGVSSKDTLCTASPGHTPAQCFPSPGHTPAQCFPSLV